MQYVTLVCDDDEDISFIEEAIVAQPGHFAIKTFRSANMVLHHLLRLDDDGFPCLIIINNNLPDMDSLELLEKIKKNPLHKLIPVAIMAGFTSQNSITQYYRAGANCYYKKPLD